MSLRTNPRTTMGWRSRFTQVQLKHQHAGRLAQTRSKHIQPHALHANAQFISSSVYSHSLCSSNSNLYIAFYFCLLSSLSGINLKYRVEQVQSCISYQTGKLSCNISSRLKEENSQNLGDITVIALQFPVHKSSCDEFNKS